MSTALISSVSSVTSAIAGCPRVGAGCGCPIPCWHHHLEACRPAGTAVGARSGTGACATPAPPPALRRHVEFKGFQFGSVVGLALVAPAVAFLHRRRGGALTVAELGPKLAKSQCISAAAGLALSSERPLQRGRCGAHCSAAARCNGLCGS